MNPKLFILFIFVLACSQPEEFSIPVQIENNSPLDVTGFEKFSCKNYLPYDIYANPIRGVNAFDKNAIFINEHPSEFKERLFSKLTVSTKNHDSLWINVEVFRILHSDTLRIANFGGRTISLNDHENQIKDIMCGFLNK